MVFIVTIKIKQKCIPSQVFQHISAHFGGYTPSSNTFSKLFDDRQNHVTCAIAVQKFVYCLLRSRQR